MLYDCISGPGRSVKCRNSGCPLEGEDQSLEFNDLDSKAALKFDFILPASRCDLDELAREATQASTGYLGTFPHPDDVINIAVSREKALCVKNMQLEPNLVSIASNLTHPDLSLAPYPFESENDSEGSRLDVAISPGDVLNIRGDGNVSALTRLGATGGFMGHVLVVVSKPCPFWKPSPEDMVYDWWPQSAEHLWRVRVVESCSSSPGLHESDMLIYVDDANMLFLCAEDDGESIIVGEHEPLAVWRAPPQFRHSNFRLDVMAAVLNDMKSSYKDWCWSTAIRAFLLPGELSQQKSITMKDIHDAWQVEPICTSVVVRFWQQYLEQIAHLCSTDPLALILRFMPLKADRVLPGELLVTMLACGWSTWETIPVSFDF